MYCQTFSAQNIMHCLKFGSSLWESLLLNLSTTRTDELAFHPALPKSERADAAQKPFTAPFLPNSLDDRGLGNSELASLQLDLVT